MEFYDNDDQFSTGLGTPSRTAAVVQNPTTPTKEFQRGDNERKRGKRRKRGKWRKKRAADEGVEERAINREKKREEKGGKASKKRKLIRKSELDESNAWDRDDNMDDE